MKIGKFRIPTPHWKKNVEKQQSKLPPNLATKEDIDRLLGQIKTSKERQDLWDMISPRLKRRLVRHALEKRSQNGNK